MNTSFQTREEALASRKWHVIDASDIPLGRLASAAAQIIRGKHKPTFAPHVDGGDFVIIVNADRVALTGKKREQKTYYWHTGYIGGLKQITAEQLLKKHPERVVERAVRGMLPKGRLGKKLCAKLHVYCGAEHPHAAQRPENFEIQRKQ